LRYEKRYSGKPDPCGCA